MLKAVVFDFDGVIVDSEPIHYEAIVRVTRERGVDFDYGHYLANMIGYDDRDAFRVAMGGQPGVDSALPKAGGVSLAELCERKTQAFSEIVDGGVTPIAGSVALVRELAEHMPIAIASGAVRREIELVLRGLGLLEPFALIVAADDVERSKPDPMTYRLAVERLSAARPGLSLEAGQCLAIEDTAAGVEAARGAGLMTLGVATTGPADRLLHAHRVVDDLSGVTLARLREWFD